MGVIKKCDVCDKSNDNTKIISGKRFQYEYLCERHYKQLTTHGTIYRSKGDKNEIIKYDDYAELILDDREKTRVIVDLDMVDILSKYKWWHNGKSRGVDYIRAEIDGKRIMLHRFIMNVTDDNLEVDHENRNTLDNRKENLRIVTRSKNQQNKSKFKTNTSGITGVTWHKVVGKWLVRINVKEGKRVSIGYFDNIEDATITRLEAEIKYYGVDFAPQRHLFEKYNLL
jgi:hypothetical protein